MESNNEKETRIYLFKIKPCSQAEMSLFAKSKVLSLASKDLNISPESVVLKKHKHGKPYIYGADNWHFNISHTDDMIGIAVSNEPVGIDVERIKGANLWIAKRFFTVSENYYIESAVCKDRSFFEIWTKKEAYLKYIGKGLSISLRAIDVFGLPCAMESFEKDGYMISVCRDTHKSGLTIEFCDLAYNKETI